ERAAATRADERDPGHGPGGKLKEPGLDGPGSRFSEPWSWSGVHEVVGVLVHPVPGAVLRDVVETAPRVPDLVQVDPGCWLVAAQGQVDGVVGPVGPALVAVIFGAWRLGRLAHDRPARRRRDQRQ